MTMPASHTFLHPPARQSPTWQTFPPARWQCSLSALTGLSSHSDEAVYSCYTDYCCSDYSPITTYFLQSYPHLFIIITQTPPPYKTFWEKFEIPTAGACFWQNHAALQLKEEIKNVRQADNLPHILLCIQIKPHDKFPGEISMIKFQAKAS